MAGDACGGTETSMLVTHAAMKSAWQMPVRGGLVGRCEWKMAGGACDGRAETSEVLDEPRKQKRKLLSWHCLRPAMLRKMAGCAYGVDSAEQNHHSVSQAVAKCG